MTLQFLVFARSRDDLTPVLNALHAAGVDFECTWADSPTGFTAALAEQHIDLVLCEEGIPPGVTAAIRAVHEQRPALPVIVLSTQAAPEMAVDAIRTGAADYLATEPPERAAEAIRKLTAHVPAGTAKSVGDASPSAERAILARLIDSAIDAIIALDEEQRVFLFNRAAEDLFGLPAARARGKTVRELLPGVPQRLSSTDVPEFSGAPRDRQPSTLLPLTAVNANGDEFPVEAAISRTRVEGRQVFSIVIRDLT
ncbi:MAG: PAS domain S-box protein, partial [Hyphomicrobiales bacterium]